MLQDKVVRCVLEGAMGGFPAWVTYELVRAQQSRGCEILTTVRGNIGVTSDVEH
jgi:hypothetical protein